MSTATLSSELRTDDGLDALQYRALHTGAILGLLLGVISVATITTASSNFEATVIIALIPLAGLIVSLWSLRTIRHQQETFTGAKIAAAGALLSALFLFGGVGYGGYVYATEVPDGYVRTSFASLKPDAIEERGNIPIPSDVAELVGERVFIKGYVRPGSQKTISREFLLVRDNNECCFGAIDKVKYYDQILVKLDTKQTASFDMRLYRVGGVLHVNPANLGRGPEYPVYTLVADYLK